MKNIVLASTSTLPQSEYLEYLAPVIRELFKGINEVVFIPYARPGGISHNDYTEKVAAAFRPFSMEVRGLHTFKDPVAAIGSGQAFFTGGGNTFLLVKELHELALMDHLRIAVESGKPYLGTSAGSNIAGVNMQTTNDMPIVLPPSFATMGLIPFNLNPHYLDPIPGLLHMGETRETRIREFHTQQNIPVVGLREGSWIRVQGNSVHLQGSHPARVFEQNKAPFELNPGEPILFNSYRMLIQNKRSDNHGMFYIEEEGRPLAELVYSMRTAHQMVIEHTEVNDSLKGKGIGLQLVETAVGYARENGIKIIPVCPFALAVFDKTPEFGDVLA